MKSLVIIPTYNEKDNIRTVIERLQALPIELDILIIDDNSPDGTADIVRELQADDPHIFMINRPAKLGLGTAYITGFRWALERDYEYILEMDADLSHNPDDVPRLIQECENGYDLVIGSRYVSGVNVINWPMSRLLLSYCGNKFASILTGISVKDCTGGFKCFRRELLEKLDLDKVSSSGYSFQVEINYYAWKKGFRITEIPIVFTDRKHGVSKMSTRILSPKVYTSSARVRTSRRCRN